MVRREWLAEQPRPLAVEAAQARSPDQGESAPGPTPAVPSLRPGSLRARAFEAIERIARMLQLKATLSPAQASQLAIRCYDRHGAAATVWIEPWSADARYYQRCGALGVWYVTEADSRSGPAWIATLMKAVVRTLQSATLRSLAHEMSVAATPPREEPVPAAASNPDDNPYARLRVLGAADVEHFFHVDYQYEPGADVDQPPTTRIGVIYQCNQTCSFCQLAEMNTHIPPARIFAALDASRSRGATRVILTGGEPTLCRHLVDYVGYAREHGFTTIELQTNAVVLDKRERVVELHAAGLTHAQVSLHGPDGTISDRLTAAPGTHERTLAGVDNLLESGVCVLLNHLIFRDNAHLLREFVELVERRWGQHRDHLILQFHSPLNEFARPSQGETHIARYSEYAGALREAIDRARSLGFRVHDLQDPTGIPALCILGADRDYLGPILSQRRKPRFHQWESGWMTRVAACRSCELSDACMGVPRAYVELHGEDEFRPIRRRDVL